MSRVLVVSHESGLSGAPRVAALVMSCLREAGHEVTGVARSPGPLLDELRAAAPTRVEPFWRVRRRLWVVGGVAARLGCLLDLVVATWVLLRAGRCVVYVNSAGAAAYLRPARWLRRPVVLHVHESGEVLTGFLRDYRVTHVLGPGPGPVLVACSPSVARSLRELGAPDGAVHLVLSVPDEAPAVVGATGSPGSTGAGPGPGSAHGPVVVGACGAVEHRKGVDLWVQVAEAVRAERPQATFAWVGGGDPPPGARGVTGVEFLGATTDPLPVMAGFDVMTLPSRDDPFPLVVVEAMRLGKPVVAFAVGGVADQLGDTGVLVPPGEVDSFTRAVRTLVDDAALRHELGARARVRAAELFSRDAFARGVGQVMDEAVGPQHRGGPCT